MQKVVHAKTDVEQMARRDSRWIVHVVLSAFRRDVEALGTKVRGRAVLRGECDIECCGVGPAEETDRRLLIGAQRQRVFETADGAGNET